MSNPYLNQILFGQSKEQVDSEYMQELIPLMLTDERMKRFLSNVDVDSIPLDHVIGNEVATEIQHTTPRCQVNDCLYEATKRVGFHKNKGESPDESRKIFKPNSLFWAIYELQHPEESFLKTRANAEVDHRLKVVTELKKTPKRLKETNSKLTIEQTQALLGSMLVAKEDKLEFCIAYAAYYNKPIVAVYEKTYRVFSPMLDIKLDEEDAILLYVSKHESSKLPIYTAEKNLTPDMIRTIIETKIQGPLRSMTSYKTPELDELASFFQVPIKFRENDMSKEKRRKKEDVYNDIKVAIHNDMN
jgi:hypothetical protein